jgi:hypothetical protein
VRIKAGQSKFELKPGTLGIVTMYRDRKICAIRDESLRHFAGTLSTFRALLDLLQKSGAIKGGHGRARTTQLPVRLLIEQKAINKPRFWLIDPKKLMEVAQGSKLRR